MSTALSYETCGSGPPLLLVHGSFSDGKTNWERVTPLLESEYSLYALHRRGRGRTAASAGHGVEDEARDVADFISGFVAEPVFLVGHSYGAQVALAAAGLVPGRIRKLVLYEPPWPHVVDGAALAHLGRLAGDDRWDELATTFFRDWLGVPAADVASLRASELWPPIVADAAASLGDLRALYRYDFEPARHAALPMPVLLQVGSASPRELYATDALAAALTNVRIADLVDQAHEGMTTAPEVYAAQVAAFLRE